jgi:hypothetical protein
MECARLSFSQALSRQSQPRLAVDQAKVAVLEAQMRADEQTAIQAGDKAEAAAKLVLQTKDRHEAFQLCDKVVDFGFSRP